MVVIITPLIAIFWQKENKAGYWWLFTGVTEFAIGNASSTTISGIRELRNLSRRSATITSLLFSEVGERREECFGVGREVWTKVELFWGTEVSIDRDGGVEVIIEEWDGSCMEEGKSEVSLLRVLLTPITWIKHKL